MGGILSTLDRVLHSIQNDVIDSNVIYIELDKENYSLVQEEVNTISEIGGASLAFKEKVTDVGKCLVLTYNEYKVIITVNKNKDKGDDFYFAFKTKVI